MRSPVLAFLLRGCVLVPLLLLSRCERADAPRSSPAAPVPVRVGTAELRPRAVVTEVVGTVRASRRATLAPLLDGTVAEVRVGLGSRVRAGQVLVQLRAGEVGARLQEARAVAEQAERDRARAVLLRHDGAISVAQLEAALAQASVAHAKEAEARSIAERTLVRAPFDGVITAKLASAGDTALPGKPLLVVEAPSGLRLEAQVPERSGADLVVGSRVPVRLEGVDRDLDGEVAEIQPSSDDVTRTRLFKIDLPETPGVAPGRFGRVLVPGERSMAVVASSGALRRRGQLETVFVVEAGLARLRLVRSGRPGDGEVEVSSGLSGGETLVIAPPPELVDGARLEVVR